MKVQELVEQSKMMLNDPNNEYEVMDLLHRLDSDVYYDDGSGLTPVGQVYTRLKDIGEDLIAINLVYPLYQMELKEIEEGLKK